MNTNTKNVSDGVERVEGEPKPEGIDVVRPEREEEQGLEGIEGDLRPESPAGVTSGVSTNLRRSESVQCLGPAPAEACTSLARSGSKQSLNRSAERKPQVTSDVVFKEPILRLDRLRVGRDGSANSRRSRNSSAGSSLERSRKTDGSKERAYSGDTSFLEPDPDGPRKGTKRKKKSPNKGEEGEEEEEDSHRRARPRRATRRIKSPPQASGGAEVTPPRKEGRTACDVLQGAHTDTWNVKMENGGSESARRSMRRQRDRT